MIVVDTTVLVYAVGEEHPLRAPCRTLVDLARSGRCHATTTTEVVQEFAHVRARRRSRAEVAGLARDFAAVFAPLLSVDTEDLHAGLELFRRHGSLGSFDSVLAAVALRHRARLVSADRAFADVAELGHLDPGTEAFVDGLRSGEE